MEDYIKGKTKITTIAHLDNPGATCALNCALNIIGCIPWFRNYVQMVDPGEPEKGRLAVATSNHEKVVRLAQLFQDMDYSEQKRKEVSTEKVRESLGWTDHESTKVGGNVNEIIVDIFRKYDETTIVKGISAIFEGELNGNDGFNFLTLKCPRGANVQEQFNLVDKDITDYPLVLCLHIEKENRFDPIPFKNNLKTREYNYTLYGVARGYNAIPDQLHYDIVLKLGMKKWVYNWDDKVRDKVDSWVFREKTYEYVHFLVYIRDDKKNLLF
jgi:ubiquitin C-terminal hydrolase